MCRRGRLGTLAAFSALAVVCEQWCCETEARLTVHERRCERAAAAQVLGLWVGCQRDGAHTRAAAKNNEQTSDPMEKKACAPAQYPQPTTRTTAISPFFLMKEMICNRVRGGTHKLLSWADRVWASMQKGGEGVLLHKSGWFR